MKNTNTHRFSQLPGGIKLRLFGPILILTAASATLVQGIIFLLAYALGLGLPFLLVGILLDRMSPYSKDATDYLPGQLDGASPHPS